MEYDELELDTLGDQKTALFVILSDTVSYTHLDVYKRQTIVIAVLATVISTIAGTLAAIGMSRSKKILRNLVDQVKMCIRDSSNPFGDFACKERKKNCMTMIMHCANLAAKYAEEAQKDVYKRQAIP